MNKYAFALAAAVSLFPMAAYAGGCCGSTNFGGNLGTSSGLVNISPSVGLGNVSVLNGIASNNARRAWFPAC